MKLSSSFVKLGALVFAGVVSTITAGASADTLDVPTEFSSIYGALFAAQDGDEVRVSNTHEEFGTMLDLENVNVTVRSYLPDFSTPAPGAKWETFSDGDVNTYLVSLSNAGLTIEGFRGLSGNDCNVFYLHSDVTLNINDCVLTGTGTANTAAIKNASGSRNLSINIDGTSVTDNGRGIWLNQIGGNTSLNITRSSFTNNSSYIIAHEPIDGIHTVNISDTYCDTKNIRPMRFFGFRAPAGAHIENHINFDRCHFYALPNNGRYTISVAGILNTADPGSTMTVNIANTLFDLRNGADDRETVAVNSQDARDDRITEINMDHCTVLFKGVNQCGIRLRENLTTLEVSNSIFYGGGEGLAIFRSLQGETISRTNLLDDTTAVSAVDTGGSVNLSGKEIYTADPEFVDYDGADYRLTELSPALAAGEDLGITEDILGNPRPTPAGTLPDLGAYEFIATSSIRNWSVY